MVKNLWQNCERVTSCLGFEGQESVSRCSLWSIPISVGCKMVRLESVPKLGMLSCRFAGPENTVLGPEIRIKTWVCQHTQPQEQQKHHQHLHIHVDLQLMRFLPVLFSSSSFIVTVLSLFLFLFHRRYSRFFCFIFVCFISFLVFELCSFWFYLVLSFLVSFSCCHFSFVLCFLFLSYFWFCPFFLFLVFLFYLLCLHVFLFMCSLLVFFSSCSFSSAFSGVCCLFFPSLFFWQSDDETESIELASHAMFPQILPQIAWCSQALHSKVPSLDDFEQPQNITSCTQRIKRTVLPPVRRSHVAQFCGWISASSWRLALAWSVLPVAQPIKLIYRNILSIHKDVIETTNDHLKGSEKNTFQVFAPTNIFILSHRNLARKHICFQRWNTYYSENSRRGHLSLRTFVPVKIAMLHALTSDTHPKHLKCAVWHQNSSDEPQQILAW